MRGPAATQASKSVLKSETRKSEKNKTRKKQSKQIKRLRVKINGMRKNDKWYEENEMRWNHDQYKAMAMGKTPRHPVFKCEGTSIPLVEEVGLSF